MKLVCMPSCHINGGKKVELFSFSEQSYFWPKLLDGLCCFVVKLHLQIAAFSNLFFCLDCDLKQPEN